CTVAYIAGLCAFRCLLTFVVFFPPILQPHGFSPVIAVHCVLFVIKECPDIYSSFSSSTEFYHITFVRASLACLGISGSGPGNIQPMMLGACKFRRKKMYCELVNHQHFRLVSSTKVKID